MEINVFRGDRTKESVAYDLALALAAKDPAITTPSALIQRIADILPLCREAANKRHGEEVPPPAGIFLSKKILK
ncbi:hypothetical protein [Enterobacter hormaechei]|uniref:hypothetical protein n=1 Tax=Enterobacter hormaechei TaxID=158836 RepID=UPI0005CCB21A|nr:hypothetical protein [Enterobacter hormaechei]KJC00340.2 hypothetical protein TN43_15300 [Enterobacter hormaechei]KVJ46137.1 hypothetical protein AWS32_19715 [Enterobacter hormaechei subsp. xiangfangensis]MBK4570684.1 hypothetical protein [Enterobacter hormaechei]MDU7017002.1 hypothetical protein [Enterobacter sp.]